MLLNEGFKGIESPINSKAKKRLLFISQNIKKVDENEVAQSSSFVTREKGLNTQNPEAA